MAHNAPRLVRTRLIALAGGLIVGLAAWIVATAALPAQGVHDDGADYGYVYSGAKSSSAAFLHGTEDDETLYVFGSSEFSTPASLVPQVPSQVFGTNGYGLHLSLVGEAYDQDLWHAIALGALAAEGLPHDRAVLIVSPGWFVDGGIDGQTFSTRFSYSLWSAFCANASIPDATKDYVAQRLIDLGVDEAKVQAARNGLPQDLVNDAVWRYLDDLSLRRSLPAVRSKGIAMQDPTGEAPDFEAMRVEAQAYGAQHSTSNDWGVEDGFYTSQLAPVLEFARDSRSAETYTMTPEYDDLACVLDVANACDVELLVIVSPVMGPYYDFIGIDAATRATCYDRVASICSEKGVQLADFSDKEYERYFLYDIVHFGWTGWIDVEQALYEFAKGGTSHGVEG